MENFLVVSQDVENADFIVVLSGDYGNRIAKGVELYKSGKANYLILTEPHLQEKYFLRKTSRTILLGQTL